MGRRWHILRQDGCLTLSRQLPVRFDVAARTDLPLADPLRVAHQIRQDLWRAVQNIRGFSPIVTVTRSEGTLHITAGGRVEGAVSRTLSDRIQAVLDDPDKRSRWLRCAKPRQETL